MWGSGHSSRNGHPKNKHIISRKGEKTHVEFPLRLDALVDDPLYKIVCDPLFVMSFLLMVKKRIIHIHSSTGRTPSGFRWENKHFEHVTMKPTFIHC